MTPITKAGISNVDWLRVTLEAVAGYIVGQSIFLGDPWYITGLIAGVLTCIIFSTRKKITLTKKIIS